MRCSVKFDKVVMCIQKNKLVKRLKFFKSNEMDIIFQILIHFNICLSCLLYVETVLDPLFGTSVVIDALI